ncbi:MAG: CBS domain-containing protein [Geminicoccaceae bacterium]|nr:MAG: CBS domain-containing protein [Geminicoccaceae bacterium]
MFGPRLTLFRLLGIEIRLDFSWALLAILITWSLAVGFFPFTHPDLAPSTYWTMGALGALGLFVSIVLHELAHAVVARRDGMGIDGITLFVFGGVAEMKSEPKSPGAEFRMAIAGPVMSVLVAALCYAAAVLGQGMGAGDPFVAVFAYLALLNTILVVFNMVPAFPLDGGRVLRAALWAWRGRLDWATRITATIGSAFGILLVVLGLLTALGGNLIGGIWWFLIGLFVRAAAGMSYRQVLVRKGLEGVAVRRIMQAPAVAVAPDLSVQALVDDYVYRHHFKLYPVTEGDRLVGCVRLEDVKEVPRERWARTAVGAIMRPCDDAVTVGPETDAYELLPKMQASGQGRFLVTEGGRLRGIVTRKDLFAFLSVRFELEGQEREGLRMRQAA